MAATSVLGKSTDPRFPQFDALPLFAFLYGMKYMLIFFSVLLTFSSTALQAQKRPLNFSDYDGWNSLRNSNLSKDGNWVSYEIRPLKGDGTLHLKNLDKGIDKEFDRGYSAQINVNATFMVFKIKALHDTLRNLEIKDTPRSKYPKDSLGIYLFEQDSLLTFGKVKSFEIGDKGGDIIAVQFDSKFKIPKKEEEGKKKKKKKKKKGAAEVKPQKPKKGTYPLLIINPLNEELIWCEHVSSHEVSENADRIAYTTFFGGDIDSAAVFTYQPSDQKLDTIYHGSGKALKPSLSSDGSSLIFLHSPDTAETKVYGIYHAKGAGSMRIVVDSMNTNMPEGMTTSENGRLRWAEDGSQFFFGISDIPREEPEDTIPNSEKAKVDVWSWTDLRLQPQQLKNKSRNEKHTFLCAFIINGQKMVQLEEDELSSVRLNRWGTNSYALKRNSRAYQKSYSWAYPWPADYSLIDIKTGETILTLDSIVYGAELSPEEKYVSYYDPATQNWMAIDIVKKDTINLTEGLCSQGEIFFTESAQVPATPYPFGIEGWTQNENVIIAAKYDLWEIDPTGIDAPWSLTNGEANTNKMRARLNQLDYDKAHFHTDDQWVISLFEENTNRSGFGISHHRPNRFEVAMLDDASISGLRKAKDADIFSYRIQTFELYPELFVTRPLFTDLYADKLQKYERVSYTNPQQEEVYWGSVKKHFWKDVEGNEMKGLLYLPEFLDESQEYPVIVYFYEKNFGTEHRHKPFRPSPSTVSIPYYLSNGYIVFVPDVEYGTGHPGKDAYNCIVSGAQSVAALPYVNAEKMAIQGQSWGGYQVAYLVTQTNMFAAGMAGAPVSNMTSAYGGIRWGSGMSRMFQYERTQSRIGEDLWSATDLYLENSPVFHLPNVETPLLIMHNDGDGAVPWYQGIEMFVGMRRLNKPCWMLNYNGDEHNLMKQANRRDLSKRMYQFFEHYLRDAPAPEWMLEGVPAVEKGKNNGFAYPYSR